jgi:hypothetical protein
MDIEQKYLTVKLVDEISYRFSINGVVQMGDGISPGIGWTSFLPAVVFMKDYVI